MGAAGLVWVILEAEQGTRLPGSATVGSGLMRSQHFPPRRETESPLSEMCVGSRSPWDTDCFAIRSVQFT